ncbi:MAG: glycerophosphoryl diester phosphodiesterase membrane domain-containing protein [bacterium]|nr:glycerophosphoryl diester phosphodiesterase membrane domain-containing protein [bacterium]
MNTTISENEDRERLLDLSPMDLSDILVRTFRIYLKRPLLFFGIVAVIAGIPMALFETSILLFSKSGIPIFMLSGESTEIIKNLDIIGTLFLVSLLFNYFLQAVATGGIVHAIRMIFLGRETDLRACLKAAWSKSAVIVRARLLAGIIYVIAFFCILLIIYISQTVGYENGKPGLLLTLEFTGLILFYCSIFFFAIKYILIPQAVIIENLQTVNALKRSWGLISGHWWEGMGVAFVINFIIFIVSSLFDLGISYLGGLVELIPGMYQYAGLVILVIFHTLFCLFLYPLSLIAYTLLYFNIRVVSEGFDLEKLQASEGNIEKVGENVEGCTVVKCSGSASV